MKKMIVLGALVLAPLASMAAEVAVCSGTSGAGADVTGAATSFVKITFKPMCSADTLVSIDQNNVALWGASGSKKGKNTFIGSTNGGSVKVSTTTCPATGCTTGEVTTAMTAAAALGT